VTDLVGRPSSAYVLTLLVAGWTVGNTVAHRLGFHAIDPPPFAALQCVACLAALLMTVSILTTQNRVAKLAQQRAHLDLQVNLIAEEKIAKVIALLEELRRDLPSVKDRTDALADSMTAAVDVRAVAGELEAMNEEPTSASRTVE
jgi:uncharacterized membrane protein